jgi:hypothetical protein
MFYPEYIRAEYQQKRKSRFQRFRKAGILFFIAAQVLISFLLLHIMQF